MIRNIFFAAIIPVITTGTALAQASSNPTKIVTVENKPVVTTRNSCTEPAAHSTFFEFFSHLKHHNGFDSEKLREAKIAAGGSCFTSHQVKVTLSAFTYEATRIEFAMFAYKYVYDQANYAEIKDGFKKESSWPEVEEYIKHH